MSKQHITPTLGSMALALAVPSAVAQTASTTATSKPAAPPPGAMEQWIKDAKNPTPWLTWGADIRVRNEYFNNAVTLSEAQALHEQDIIRYRGRVWASLLPVEDLSINTRVSAEPRTFMKTSGFPSFAGQVGTEWRFGIVDNLNVKYTNILNQPLSVTAGRQDIMFGDYWNWWLVADGTPGDGSWTFFLDSIRLAYEVPEIRTKFDLVYIYQNARPDGMFPTLGHVSKNVAAPAAPYRYNLTEQDEQGVILYASNKSIEKVGLDGYFMFKKDDQNLKVSTIGDDANIYTLGGRVTGTPTDHIQYALEGAYQFGEKRDPLLGAASPERDINAFGGTARASYLFKDSLNNQAHMSFEYLSGDDPNTADDEMFDILWGRWPRLSELYLYSYARESGKIGQWNNIWHIGPGWSLNPFKKTSVSAYYHALFAPEQVPTRAGRFSPGAVGPTAAPLFSGIGNFRGHYIQAVLKHQFTPRISGHLWSEFIFQGDYYAQRDLMTFLRAEVLVTF